MLKAAIFWLLVIVTSTWVIAWADPQKHRVALFIGAVLTVAQLFTIAHVAWRYYHPRVERDDDRA